MSEASGVVHGLDGTSTPVQLHWPIVPPQEHTGEGMVPPPPYAARYTAGAGAFWAVGGWPRCLGRRDSLCGAGNAGARRGTYLAASRKVCAGITARLEATAGEVASEMGATSRVTAWP